MTSPTLDLKRLAELGQRVDINAPGKYILISKKELLSVCTLLAEIAALREALEASERSLIMGANAFALSTIRAALSRLKQMDR